MLKVSENRPIMFSLCSYLLWVQLFRFPSELWDCFPNTESHDWNQEVTKDQQFRMDSTYSLCVSLHQCVCVCVFLCLLTTSSLSSQRQKLLLCSPSLPVCKSAFMFKELHTACFMTHFSLSPQGCTNTE